MDYEPRKAFFKEVWQSTRRLRRFGCDKDFARSVISHWASGVYPSYVLGTQNCPLDPVFRTFDRAWESDRDFDHTGMGNEDRFIGDHKDDVRYCHGKKQWFIWDDMRWKEDDKEEIKEKSKQTVKGIKADADTTMDPGYREALEAHWRRSSTHGQIMEMTKLAQSNPRVAVAPEEFDKLERTKWLLYCENGTIDLRTGELRRHNRDDLITKVVPIEYNPDARYQHWEDFLCTVTEKNWDLIRFLQRIVGYSLTGETMEKCLFFLLGPTDSGKTTFVETIRELLGDYASATDFQTFLYGRSATVRNDIARLEGARFVSASEAKREEKFDEVLIKQVTGKDTIAARFLYREFREFTPQFKIFLASNHGPRMTVSDDAVWNRIHVLPFNVSIPKKQQDRNLRVKFEKERSGILGWAIRGCLEWQKKGGLHPPDVVIDALKRYRKDADVLWAFIEERCKRSGFAAASDLWEEWGDWCFANGLEEGSKKAFGIMLTDKGFERGKRYFGKKQVRGYNGISVNKIVIAKRLKLIERRYEKQFGKKATA